MEGTAETGVKQTTNADEDIESTCSKIKINSKSLFKFPF